jgi:hypothetical protein
MSHPWRALYLGVLQIECEPLSLIEVGFTDACFKARSNPPFTPSSQKPYITGHGVANNTRAKAP